MADPRHKKFTFEGQELSIAEIHERYLPAVSTKLLRGRLIATGATSLQQYRDSLDRPTKAKAKSSEELRTRVRESTTVQKRFSRSVRTKVDDMTGEKGCNYCHRTKPIDKMKVIKGNRYICETCNTSRSAAISNSTKR
jgi:hypothetical protein